jgi:PAS domain-containing protein
VCNDARARALQSRLTIITQTTRVSRTRAFVSTKSSRAAHDRRGSDRPANGERKTCTACGEIARFEERYVVGRRGVTMSEPAWVCAGCAAETFVRRREAKVSGGAGGGDARADAHDGRLGEIRELRRVLGDIRSHAGALRDEPGATRRRAQPFLEALTHAQLVSVIAADDRARLVAVNAAASALTGIPRDMLLTMTVRDLFTAQPQRFDRSWQRFVERGEFSGVCRLRQRAGRLVTVECVAGANVIPGLHVGTLASRRLLRSLL